MLEGQLPMLNMSTALSAIRASQIGLSVVGNNIANANTPGYHRQELRLVDAMPVEINNLQMGMGVEISHIHRAYDLATENALTRNISEQSSISAQLDVSREIESILTPGHGAIVDRLESLFNDLSRLTADPDNSATRAVVIGSAQSLSASINTLAQGLHDLTLRLDTAIESQLALIRDKSEEIADLNIRIREAEIRQQSPNDLLDRRDALVNELADIVDTEIDFHTTLVGDQEIPETVIRLAEGQAYILRTPLDLRSTVDPSGKRLVVTEGGDRTLDITLGKLGGLLTARNELVREYQERLETFTVALSTAFDTVHANGLGVSGSFESLTGIRHFEEVDVPLEQLRSLTTVQAGTLFIGIVDPAGTRTVHEVSIDPEIDTLEDVANRISTVDHLTARVNAPPGQLTLVAEPGYSFDFLTTQPTLLDTSLISGSVEPVIQGQYEGQINERYTFEFQDSGTIGTSASIRLTARDRVGALVAEFEVGNGYEPGSLINIGQGVSLRIPHGEVVAGDMFSASLLRQSDESNLLAAVGMNTLFGGHSALTFRVNDDLMRDPNRFAMTLSGDPLDSRNLEQMVNLRYAQVMSGGTETLEENLSRIVASIGSEVLDLTNTEETLSAIGQTLQSSRDSISGVDPNEEAVRMLQFQRAFQSAARYIATLDQTLEELINIIR